MTMLHSGGKFSGKAYETSGGLHGVGVSVVNALSERVEVTVWKDGFEWRQAFSRGKPHRPHREARARPASTAPPIRFQPDPVIFGEGVAFKPGRASTAWRAPRPICSAASRSAGAARPRASSDQTPAEATFHFPNGLADFLAERIKGIETVTPSPSPAAVERQGEAGAVEWAVTWTPAGFGEADGFMQSYCNTVPTPEGGTHEAGLRAALTRGLKAYAELTGEKRGAHHHRRRRDRPGRRADQRLRAQPGVPGPDQGAAVLRPTPSGWWKRALRDPFDHWLTAQPKAAARPARLRHRARRGAAEAPQGQGGRPRLGDPQAAPARQAGRLFRPAPSTAPRLFLVEGDSRRRLGQAGPRPQAPRRSCPCAARS